MPGCECALFSAGACRDHRTVLAFLELDMLSSAAASVGAGN